MLNHAPVEPAVDGSTYSWELKELPLIKKEPDSPQLDSLCSTHRRGLLSFECRSRR